MNEVPPGQDETDDADDLYRRASALDDSRPSERVRRRVLDHAAQLAAERVAQISAAKLAATRAANRRWRRPAIFGTLAAAALAGLLVTPRFFTPGAPPPTASQLSTASLPPPAAPPQAAPPQAAESRLQEAQAPAAYAPAPQRTPARTAEFAAKNNLAAPKIMDSAGRKAAASAEIEADARRGQDVTSGATAALAPPHSIAPAAAAPRASDPAAELRQAAETGDIPRLQMLLGRQPTIDARDANGRTALMLAVLRGESRAVDTLLASGADPNAADGSGTTPLQAAIAGNQAAIVAALQRAGAR
jgi:hypothetical protein